MNLAELRTLGTVYIVEDMEVDYRHRIFIGCSGDPNSSIRNIKKRLDQRNVRLVHNIESVDPFGTKQRLREGYREFQLKRDDYNKTSPQGWFDLDGKEYMRLLRIEKDNSLLTLRYRMDISVNYGDLFFMTRIYYYGLLHSFFRKLYDRSVRALSNDLKSMDIGHYQYELSFLNADCSYNRYPTRLDEVLIDWNTSLMQCFLRALRYDLRADYWKLIRFLAKLYELSNYFSNNMRWYVKERESYEDLERSIQDMKTVLADASTN